jgi:capsular exopolysaccharide synthesis family protein
LNASLGQAENDRIAAQTAYQAALQNQMWKTQSEGNDPQVNGLEGKLNELRQKLAQLKTQYTDEWFEVVQTKKQIENVDAQLKSIKQRATGIQLAALQQKLNEAIAREKVFKANFDQQRAEVIQQNEASINYKIIQQEIDTNKSLLDGLLQSSKENEIVMSGTQNNVLVLDRAMVPGSPSGPERNRSILVAFMASLAIGFGLAFMIDWLNDSVSYAQDLEGILGLPVLGTVPAAPLGFGRKLLPTGLSLNGKHKKLDRNYDLQVFEKPQFLESYMQMGTYMLLSTAGGPPQTVLVTSGEEGEGKTMTALNLATSLAKTKGKILIVDADLRCPRIHKIKELNNKIGLTTLLAMPEFTPELIDQAIQKDPNCNLDIMTSGEHTLNPGNLLSSKEMGILLKKLKGTYSHIIIDSPPVLYFADSAILSTMTDAVILVVRDNISSKGSVLNAKKALQKIGAKIIGIVLNGVPIKSTNYYKQSYYQSHDGITSENGNHILKLQ